MRSPSSPLVEVTTSPIFFPTVPDRNPRIEWGNQFVAFISSLAVTPPGRFSSSSILSVLLPSRTGLAALAFFAPLGAFLAGVAFSPTCPSSVPCSPFGSACAFGGFRFGRGGRHFDLFSRIRHVRSLRDQHRGDDINHSSSRTLQGNFEGK